MKAKEVRKIRINSVLCEFKVYDTYVVAVPPINRYRKITEMIRAGDESCEEAIQRLIVIARREWNDIAMFVESD